MTIDIEKFKWTNIDGVSIGIAKFRDLVTDYDTAVPLGESMPVGSYEPTSFGFTVKGQTKYTDFALKARNVNGFSIYSAQVGKIFIFIEER